jgi:Protein of unknown function (DUF3703)
MNFKMPKSFKEAYRGELRKYKEALREKQMQAAWRYLERAHIIGQYHPVSHSGSHFRMLLFAVRTADVKEFLGQFIRLAGGWLGSMMNRIPVGNTGGANVPIFSPMPIPEDLRHLLSAADTESKGLSGLRSNPK